MFALRSCHRNLKSFFSFEIPNLASRDSVCISLKFWILYSVIYFQIVKTKFSSGLSGREVYLFPWLGAKPAHIEKYFDQLYGKVDHK